MSSLHQIFYPGAIAIVGASKDQTKRGYRAIQKLLQDGFAGAIYPVHPKEPEILGLRAYQSLEDIPGPVDLALICTPARTVPDVIAQCGAKGVRGAVVLAGGFAEAGKAGAELQDAMVAQAHAHGVRIIGPNTSGIFNTHAHCNIVGFSDLKRGGIGLLSQSGNMALSLVTEAQANGHIGLSTYIGIGNESDIRFHEYLEYFRDDPNTHAVVSYVEGMKDGRGFLQALTQTTRKKPVVIYKSGRTSAGRNAAQSHTGALAGEYAVSEGVLRQAGAILARKSDEILSLAEALSLLKPLEGRRIAVLADGGGHATIAADALSEHGLTLASLNSDTKNELAVMLPPAASIANPIDVAGATDANPALFAVYACLILQDPNVDALLITGLYGGYGQRFAPSLTPEELETSDQIAAMHREFGKPIIVHSLYGSLRGDLRPQPLTRIRAAGIPVYESLELAVRCLQVLAEYGEMRRRTGLPVSETHARSRRFEEIIDRCRSEGRTVVLEHEARDALQSAGIDAKPAAIFARDASEALAAFHRLGSEPVALKIVSQDIVHKSDAGGVKLNISDEEELARAYTAIMENGRQYIEAKEARDANIAGVLVAPMAAKGGVEIIIGVVRDPAYGPVLMFGLGGILVEVMKDVVFRAIPLSEADARSMLQEIRAANVLDGVRGAPPVDKEALVRLILSISDLCAAFPEIDELDLNPVLAYPTGVAIIDARMLLGSSTATGL